MNTRDLKELIDGLESKMKEQEMSNQYFGKALYDRFKKVVKIRMKKLDKSDLESGLEQLDGDSNQIIKGYLRSIINPVVLEETQIEVVQELFGGSRLSADSHSQLVEEKIAHLIEVSKQIGQEQFSRNCHCLSEGMNVTYALSDDGLSIKVKLQHPDAKKSNATELADITVDDVIDCTEFLTDHQVEGAKAFITSFQNVLNNEVLVGSKDEDDRKVRAGRLLDMLQDKNKIDSMFTDAYEIKSKHTEDLAFRAMSTSQVQDLLKIQTAFSEIRYLPEDPKQQGSGQEPEENEHVSEDNIRRVREINARNAQVGKIGESASDNPVSYQTVELVFKLAAFLKYIAAGQYEKQNKIVSESGLFTTLEEIKANETSEVRYRNLKSRLISESASADTKLARPSNIETQNMPNRTTVEAAVGTEESMKIVFEYLDSIVDIFTEAQSLIVESKDYMKFSREAGEIKTFTGNVKTLFDSRRAISRPLYAALIAIAAGSSVYIAPAAYAGSLVLVSLSALTYAAGKLWTMSVIASRAKVPMKEIGSKAFTVGSHIEIGAVALSTAAAFVYPLGIAGYAITLPVRAAFSALVTSLVSLKEFAVNVRIPSGRFTPDAFVSSTGISEGIGQLGESEAFKKSALQLQHKEAVKMSQFKDFKVSEELIDGSVTAVLEQGVSLSQRCSVLSESATPQGVKSLASDLKEFTNTDRFKQALSSADLKNQAKGREFLNAVKCFSCKLEEAAVRIAAGDKAVKHNNDVHKKQFDENTDYYGLQSLMSTVSA